MDNVTTIGIDLAKSVFQLHGFDARGKVLLHLGAALGIAPRAIAELLPPIEAVMVRKISAETRPER